MIVSKNEAIYKYQQHGGTNTPHFTLHGVSLYGRVCDVYDGDTVTLILEVDGAYRKFKARLNGIDTCEIKSKSSKNRELACKARLRLIELITDSTNANNPNKKDTKKLFEDNVYVVWVKCYEFDKYGRVLVDLFTDEESPTSFSQTLNEEHLAYTYQGDTKLTEEQQVEVLERKK